MQQRSTPNKLAAEESPMLVIFQRGASMLKEYGIIFIAGGGA